MSHNVTATLAAHIVGSTGSMVIAGVYRRGLLCAFKASAKKAPTGGNEKMNEEEWNEINEAIAIDGDGKATGLHYAPEMECARCGKMTDRNKMVWVRIRTYNGGTTEKWCNTCDTN